MPLFKVLVSKSLFLTKMSFFSNQCKVVDESDKRANYLLKFCRPITETINFILAKIDPINDEEELITCAASTVSLMVHMWGGESLELGDIDRILEALSRRNQRLILKALRKATTDKLVQNRSLLSKIERIASLRSSSNISFNVQLFSKLKKNLE